MMTPRKKLSHEAKMLIREYGLRVARKQHPGATVEVHVDDYLDENGFARRTVTIVSTQVKA